MIIDREKLKSDDILAQDEINKPFKSINGGTKQWDTDPLFHPMFKHSCFNITPKHKMLYMC